ncbi:hypothetical protein SUGI_0962480 [Cryptomeria japonica]|uniref:uncharacterized protein LOC131039839 n=1 Tax=Cryptomeria japonica TaxID=3369 RepID=UPI00241468DE|nr:uncharacterized protein LOC131039839 [Cryptomeria japonica]XP_057828767.2 uncharacterized protein LOC131039839 [Cryptomeria japonica]XP_057828838.2 uncharacterized protein LOC131039839 [Cryptomeria japonica]GLJ45734.1 hypothetical protein SUGI_0962480 [Cryptomeria japonica]
MEQSTDIAKRLDFDEDVDASIDLDFFYRRIEELAKLPRHIKELENEAMAIAELEMCTDSYFEKLKEMTLGIRSEYIDLTEKENCLEYSGIDDSDMQLQNLKNELHCAQVESARISEEIENLASTAARDVSQLAHELFALETYLNSSKEENKDDCKPDQNEVINQLEKQLNELKMEEAKWNELKRHENWMLFGENYKFEALKLKDELIEKRAEWRNLQKLDDMCKQIEAIRMVEDLLCDIKDISFVNGCIQLSLKTCIPALGGSLCQFKFDCIKESFAVDHRLLIKTVAENMTLQDAELIPNDVPIDDIVNAAKVRSDPVTAIALAEFRGRFEFLVKEIQFRIYCHNIRLALLEHDAKLSRNSFSYSERDQVITVHVFGGIKAFIKVANSWPVSTSPLKLISLKPLDESAGDISFSMLCKAMEISNSLDMSRRQSLLLFIDAIEDILLQQMQKPSSFGK